MARSSWACTLAAIVQPVTGVQEDAFKLGLYLSRQIAADVAEMSRCGRPCGQPGHPLGVDPYAVIEQIDKGFREQRGITVRCEAHRFTSILPVTEDVLRRS